MNRNHLAVFRTVAVSGSFTRAADELLVGQPALSAQVAELESSVGVRLLERLPRGVKTTEAGALLLGYAQRIETAEREAEQAVREFRGLARGRLKLGASLTIGSYVLPPLLRQFRDLHPAIELNVEIGNSSDITALLRAGAIDLALTEDDADLARKDSAIDARAFAQDTLVAIAAHAKGKRSRSSMTAAQFCRQPMIAREAGSGTRAVVDRALARRGIRVTPTLRLGSTEAVKAAVVCGLGVSIVSSRTIAAELFAKTLEVCPLKDLAIRRSFLRSTLRGRSLGPGTIAFIKLLDASE